MTIPENVGHVHAASWHEVHRDSTDLAERLVAQGPWTGIVAVARGGLVPAAIVSRVLSVRRIESVALASYDGRVKGPVRIERSAATDLGTGAGWLVIDDLADTGATAEAVRAMLPSAYLAALYAKPAGRAWVDTFVREVSQQTWVDFPWERDPAPLVP